MFKSHSNPLLLGTTPLETRYFLPRTPIYETTGQEIGLIRPSVRRPKGFKVRRLGGSGCRRLSCCVEVRPVKEGQCEGERERVVVIVCYWTYPIILNMSRQFVLCCFGVTDSCYLEVKLEYKVQSDPTPQTRRKKRKPLSSVVSEVTPCIGQTPSPLFVPLNSWSRSSKTVFHWEEWNPV